MNTRPDPMTGLQILAIPLGIAVVCAGPNSLFGQFERLRRELDDVFGVSALPSSIRSVAPGTVPAVNVGRTPSSVEIYAFAPGLDASMIEVTFDRSVRRISGERASGIPTNDPEVQV